MTVIGISTPTVARRAVHHLLRLGLAASMLLMFLGLAIKVATGDHHDDTVALFDLGHAPHLG